MYPDLFGISGFSMTFMIIVGVVAASILLFVYLHKRGTSSNQFLDLSIVIVATVFVGVVFAILVENVYEAIKHSVQGEPQAWTWGMTFYGGLAGGIPTFLLMYKYYYLKHGEPVLKNIVIIAPACITLGHAFGRIGCFLDGCCYGKPTTSWIGVKFPLLPEPVIPTQLIESAFLFLLTGILLMLVLVFKFKYTFIVYLGSYSIFRFIIEFFRGDDRGNFLGIFSPSQVWSMFIWVIIVPFFFVLKKLVFVEKKPDDKEQNN